MSPRRSRSRRPTGKRFATDSPGHDSRRRESHSAGPTTATVVPVLEQLELFRVVNVDRPHHPGLVLDFTSNYERGARPRRIERVFAIVHMGDLHLHDDRGRVSWTSGSTVMTHGIFTSTGNVVAWFDTEDEALAALGDLVAEEPEAADEIAAIPFDDEGHACGPAIKGSTMLPAGADVA